MYNPNIGAGNHKLTPKEKRAIEHYMIHFNKVQAFIHAGYSHADYDSARTMASRLFAKPHVKAEIERLLEMEHKQNLILKTKIRRRYEVIAFADISDILEFRATTMRGEQRSDKSKRVTVTTLDTHVYKIPDLKLIPEELRPAIKAVKKTDRGFHVEFYDAMGAMAELRKMYGFDEPIKTHTTVVAAKIRQIKVPPPPKEKDAKTETDE